MILRDYQERFVESVGNEFRTRRSTMIVAATGLGKTVVALSIAKRMLPGRTLVIANRRELIFQAVDAARKLGLTVEIEMAEHAASQCTMNRPQVVVTTVQTQMSRMHKFDPNDYALVWTDECHGAGSKTFRKVISHYQQNPNIKLLGVTATPQRGDGLGMGNLFESCPEEQRYDILDGIRDGWLVPVYHRNIHVRGLRFDRVKVSAGELNAGDLAKQLEQDEIYHRIMAPTSECIGKSPTLMFCHTVRQAEHMVSVAKDYGHEFGFVCGKTPTEQRKEVIGAFKAGQIQGLVNVGVLVEGFDSPHVAFVVMAKPTLSRTRFVQMLGRGTRPLPGIVDGISTPEGRQFAIAASAKGRMTVLDFYGNGGRHRIVHAGDVLGGRAFDDTLEKYVEKARGKEAVCVTDAVEEAEREVREAHRQARATGLRAVADFRMTNTDLFGNSDLAPVAKAPRQAPVISDGQRAVLIKNKFNPDQMNPWEQKKALVEIFRRRNSGLLGLNQEALLVKFGYTPEQLSTMKFEQASFEISRLKANGWRKLP